MYIYNINNLFYRISGLYILFFITGINSVAVKNFTKQKIMYIHIINKLTRDSWSSSSHDTNLCVPPVRHEIRLVVSQGLFLRKWTCVRLVFPRCPNLQFTIWNVPECMVSRYLFSVCRLANCVKKSGHVQPYSKQLRFGSVRLY